MSLHPLDRPGAEPVAPTRSAREIDLARTLGGARPTHTVLMAVDICAFGRRRDEEMQLHLRDRMYGVMATAFEMTRLPWQAAYREDRGDGALIILPPAAPVAALLDALAHHTHALLRRGNKFTSDTARLRLRLAVHSGEVHGDSNGVAGNAVLHLFRLLDCGTFKKMLASGDVDLGVIVSDPLYQDATNRPGFVDSVAYQKINFRSKETRGRAWVWLPPQSRADH